GGLGVLDDVATVNDAARALREEVGGALQDDLVGDAAAAAHEDGDAAGGLYDLVVDGDVVGGVGLDDVGAELDGLTNERDDLGRVSVHHVAAGLGVGLEDERLDHERHAVVVADRLKCKYVLNTLVGDLGLVGDAEEVHDDAGGVEAERLHDGIGDDAGKQRPRELVAIDVGDVGAQDEGGFGADGQHLEMRGLPDGELDGVGRGGDQRLDGFGQVFDAGEKGRFVEEAVVDGDVEAAAGLRVEETVEAGGFHGWEAGEWRRRPSRLRARRSLREKGWSLTKSLKAFHGAKRRAAGLAHLLEWATRMRRVA